MVHVIHYNGTKQIPNHRCRRSKLHFYMEDGMTQDEKYMREAIKQAKKAYALGEVPIGCVIVYQDKIIGRGYNRRNTDRNTLAHAEITAINKASRNRRRAAAVRF